MIQLVILKRKLLVVRILRTVILLFMLFVPIVGLSQEKVIQDTLKAAVKEDFRVRRDVGTRFFDAYQIRSQVSPLGESDYIKLIQTLPGVSSGADGSSAFYVRGGDLGGNVVTLDAVPVYGSSHLLGFTTVLSNDVVEQTDFRVGGFDSEDSNISSSLISLRSSEGQYDSWSGTGSLSTFMLSGSVTGPLVKDKISAIFAARYSPLGVEFGLVDKFVKEIDDLSSSVYDVFGKVIVRPNDRQTLSAFVFHSMDDYNFRQNGQEDRLGWTNIIGQVKWNWRLRRNLQINTDAYWSFKHSLQSQKKTVHTQGLPVSGAVSEGEDVDNYFSITDNLNEWSFRVSANWQANRLWTVSSGAQWRGAAFNPGAMSRYGGSILRPEHSTRIRDNRMNANTLIWHAHATYQWEDRLKIRGAVRWNRHVTTGSSGTVYNKWGFSILGRLSISDHFGLEGTADRLVQLYHTLEGLPVGWSLDMIIPSDKDFAPETVLQFYGGVYGQQDEHSWRVGPYWKRMDNLLYFEDGGALFNGTLSSWRSGLYSGEGSSYGLEMIYEYDGNNFDGKVSYTLSKADRRFRELNEGKPFPAKFDRRHMLNISSEVVLSNSLSGKIGMTTQLTLQSGCWETVPVGYYTVPMMGGDEVTVTLYSHSNNFKMPAFFRWDAGWYLEKTNAGTKRRLNIGIYNITNRHNPFIISYDADKKEWRQISLLPIMPGFSYRVKF